MHHVRHQDDRDCQVCQDAVRLLDQRQQAKLCDKEVRDAADKRGKNLGAGNFAWGFGISPSLGEAVVDSFYHGGNHVDGGGDSTKNDQNRNQRCHKFTADALLNHKERRDALPAHFRILIYGHNSENDHNHHQCI